MRATAWRAASRPRDGLLVAAALLAMGCGQPVRCTPTPLSEAAATVVPAVTREVGFAPEPPCAFGAAFRVERLFTDRLPGQPSLARAHYAVMYRQQPAFTLSETRATMPFAAIPQGSHPIHVAGPGATASGFAGPSGSGGDVAYLRWRHGDVTFELFATLAPWLTERDVLAIAAALMERHVVASSAARHARPLASPGARSSHTA